MLIKKILLATPFINTKIRHYDHLKQVMLDCGFAPGHYYSPIPNLAEIEKNADSIFGSKELLEIDLNTEKQTNLLEEFAIHYNSYLYNAENVDSKNLRYKKEGAFYKYSDSVFLYCMMRNFKPKKIIEVGSGHSSAIMLDTNEMFFENKTHLTFIEPYPEERLFKILKESDKVFHTIIKEKVQSVKLNVFQTLAENDILFIDSTHISKIGSDVNYILFEILPTLKAGVLIHFHDIFYPFEMPKHWVVNRRWFWNENYLLHAFLMNNKNYEIVNFNTYLHKIKTDWFKEKMPECLLDIETTGSIWMRKLL